MVVPLFKKGDQMVCSDYQGFSRVLEWRVRLLLQPQIQEGHCDFHAGPWNTGPPLYSCNVTEGDMSVCLTSPHLFCGSAEVL